MESATDESLLHHVQKADIEVMVATRDSMMTLIVEEVMTFDRDSHQHVVLQGREHPDLS